MILFQYQQRAEPILPIQNASTVPVPVESQHLNPAQRIFSVAAIAPSLFFTPLVTATAPTPIPYVSPVDSARPVPNSQYLQQRYGQLASGTATPSGISVGKPDSVPRPAPSTAHLQQSVAFVPLVSAAPETVTIDKWLGSRPDSAARLPSSYLYPSFSTDPASLVLKEATSVDRWIGYHPDRIDGVASRAHLIQNPQARPSVFSSAEVITPDKWLGYQPPRVDGLPSRAHLYPSLAIDPFQLTQKEATSPDRWSGYRPASASRTAPKTYAYPSLAFVPVLTAAVPPLGWAPSYPPSARDVARRSHLVPYFAIDPKQLTQKERSTPDKWLGYQPGIVYRVPRNGSLYPTGALVQIVTDYPPNGCPPRYNTSWSSADPTAETWLDTKLFTSTGTYDSATDPYDSASDTYDGTVTNTYVATSWASSDPTASSWDCCE